MKLCHVTMPPPPKPTALTSGGCWAGACAQTRDLEQSATCLTLRMLVESLLEFLFSAASACFLSPRNGIETSNLWPFGRCRGSYQSKHILYQTLDRMLHPNRVQTKDGFATMYHYRELFIAMISQLLTCYELRTQRLKTIGFCTQYSKGIPHFLYPSMQL